MSDYNPYAPPQSELPRDGKLRSTRRSPSERVELTLPAQTAFGKVCVKCGTSKEVVFSRKKLPFVPPLAYASVLLCGVIGVALIFVTRKVRELDVPLCVACSRGWGRAVILESVIQAGIVLLVIAATFLSAFALAETRLAAVAAIAAAVVAFFIGRRLEERGALRLVSIERTGLVLRSVHPKVVRRLRRD